TVDRSGLGLENLLLVSAEVPDSHLAIRASRCDRLAIRSIGQEKNRSGVELEGRSLFPCGQVPNPHGTGLIPNRQGFSIRSEGQGVVATVAIQGCQKPGVAQAP